MSVLIDPPKKPSKRRSDMPLRHTPEQINTGFQRNHPIIPEKKAAKAAKRAAKEAKYKPKKATPKEDPSPEGETAAE